jgi:hypothetical protein
MYRVRFHLAKGQHYRMWQVRHPDGTKTYHDPDTTCLVMHGCYLRNSRRVAERIHAGANKAVCAWVLCRSVQTEAVSPSEPPVEFADMEVRFNPRILPHWHNHHGTDLDGTRFRCVTSWSRTLFGHLFNVIG